MAKFIISTDTCADLPKSFYEENGIQYIILKRILKEQEISECFDKPEEFDAFYDNIKKGDLPTTVQLNPFELKEYFEGILEKEKEGDIIHISLSSGLSTTCINAQSAAEEVNKDLEKAKNKRRVHVVDSLIATLGMGQMIIKLMELRDSGTDTKKALEKILHYRDRQQGWVIMTDLFHLRRGGRISGAKAALGTVLNLRPIIHLSKKGKLPMENKMRGNIKAVKYILARMEKYGEKFDKDFATQTVWVVRTSNSDLYDLLKRSIISTYPNLTIREGIVGPIIGTHLGCGGVCVLWEGAPRLDID